MSAPAADLAAPASLRRRIGARVVRDHPRQVEFLAQLVKTPSDNPPGDCAAHAEAAAGLLEALGLHVERHPVPADEAARAGMRSAVNLVVRRRFGDGPTVALNAHGDVVPPGEGWSRDPYGAQIHDGRMYGRGVAVSKSDFATYAFALLALEDAAEHLAGAVELHFTYDEETGGGIGPDWILRNGLSHPDYAICAGFSYAVVTAHSGCLHLEVRLRGRQAHAALPETGADALEAASRVLTALYAEREKCRRVRSAVPGIDSPSLVVGVIEGGINTNVVPDLVRMRLDRRLIPEESAEAVENGLRRVIMDSVAGQAGIGVEIERILLARPLAPTAGSAPLAAMLCAHAGAVLGEPVPTRGVPLYTDARHYAARGIPVVLYGAGPRTLAEANAHAADENLRLDDLRAATEVVALTLADLLGPEGADGTV